MIVVRDIHGRGTTLGCAEILPFDLYQYVGISCVKVLALVVTFIESSDRRHEVITR